MYPIDDLWSARMRRQTARGNMGAKLAFVRLGFNYFISEAVFEYIVEAVHLLANEGWKLLPLYRFDPASGAWRHRSARPRPLVDLEDIVSAAAGARPLPRRPSEPEDVLLQRYLDEARQIIRQADAAPAVDPVLEPDFEQARWFPLPSEGMIRSRAASEGRA